MVIVISGYYMQTPQLRILINLIKQVLYLTLPNGFLLAFVPMNPPYSLILFFRQTMQSYHLAVTPAPRSGL